MHQEENYIYLNVIKNAGAEIFIFNYSTVKIINNNKVLQWHLTPATKLRWGFLCICLLTDKDMKILVWMHRKYKHIWQIKNDLAVTY